MVAPSWVAAPFILKLAFDLINSGVLKWQLLQLGVLCR